MDNSSVKKNVLDLRERLGYSQEEMAEQLKVSRNTYRNIEKGRTKLISPNVMKIAELANISVEELVLGYMPVKDKTIALQDEREKWNAKLRSTRDELNAQIEALRNENEILKKALKLAEDSVQTKDDMIAMLEKQLNTDKND